MNIAESPAPKPVALIAGPTASGKSALAIALAEAVSGTVINADASQLYADLRVLSARPSPEEEARVPHRLFGTRDGADPASAADWAEDARGAIDEAHAAGRVPILVGGTGLYLRTLIDGIAPVPPVDPDVRSAVRALAVADAHAALMQEDPAAAARLRASDTTRVARALEVVRSSGRPLSDWQLERQGGIGDRITLAATILLPPREWLRARCDARFETMLSAGAIDEVRALLARDLDPATPVMRAIGVREISDWLTGTIDRDAMVARATAATRQYAKRQHTWFANQPPPSWQRQAAQLDEDSMRYLVRKLRERLLTY
ncbi:tRNA (adenosine(37)-N6)-dimethylallyltransferase MiaA [Sphingomonas sp. 1P06PA]|uniref:tRNA (adenosine(37)-N6)-dimethylallyltransferase MiaA n=1 Tax=Sphingomonas sp. 1P06PA TaxID=554121 RepID=UPI0039A761C6